MLNQLKTVLLLGILSGLFLAIGYALGGQSGIIIALIFAGLMNLVTYWFSDKIVLFLYGAKEAKKSEYPELHSIVEKVSHLAGIPKPKVYIIPLPNPNAFATGRNPNHAAVAATAGILKLLTKEELTGVLSHEISHVKNRDILVTTIAATIAAAISSLASMARWGFVGGERDRDSGGLIGLLILTILTPIIAMILQLAISRSREYLADESGAKLLKDGEPLARALEKLEKGVKLNPMRGNPATGSLFIVNPFTSSGLLALLSTHPSLEKRVQRLRAMKF